ncbi:hypothetical protein B0H34DRAFT_624996, partial [Crassisporium funariophilum]
CNSCLAPLIVHQDSCCITHLAKTDNDGCTNAPADVKFEAQRRLIEKGGIEIPNPGSDAEEIIEIPSTNGPASKKAKSSQGSMVETKQSLDAYLDRAMTKDEQDKANIRMLRFFIHGNISFNAARNSFFLKWVHTLQPSYDPASRYVL